MKTTAYLLILTILIGCGGPNTPPTNIPTVPPNTLASPTSAPDQKSIDFDTATAKDWVHMDRAQRERMAEYWLNFWKKEGVQTTITPIEMQVCITEEVVRPGEPLTMMIMAIASRCVQR